VWVHDPAGARGRSTPSRTRPRPTPAGHGEPGDPRRRRLLRPATLRASTPLRRAPKAQACCS
jgi:hypothetical protein